MVIFAIAFIYAFVLIDNVGHARSAAVAHYEVILFEILRSLCDLGGKREEE